MRPRLLDLSHPIETGMRVHPGLPSPRIEAHISHQASRASYGGDAEFEVTRLFLVGNTGTTIDSPYHRFRGEPDVADLPLSRLVDLPGHLLAPLQVSSASRALDPLLPGEPEALQGCAVLIGTGWSRHWGTQRYWHEPPFLAASFAERLAQARPALVGVDLPNVDDLADSRRPAHTTLLAAGIPIVEHLTGLQALPVTGFRFFAAPVAFRRAAAVPVRAFALLSEPTL